MFGTTADTKACDDNYANVFTSTVTGKTEDIMNHIYTVTFAAAVNVFTFYIDLPQVAISPVEADVFVVPDAVYSKLPATETRPYLMPYLCGRF